MRAFLAAAIFSSRESFSAMSRSVFCFFLASADSSRILAFAILIKRTSGILLGQTKAQQPHSMQSRMRSRCIASLSPAFAAFTKAKGRSLEGHTLAHLPHLMHSRGLS